MTTGGVPSNGDGFSSLFEASPDYPVHTSVAAELGMLIGLGAFVAAPFSVMQVLALGAAVLGFGFSFVGLVTTSRPHVAGGALAPLGLVLSFVAAGLIGLRYLGVDTAFGDEFVPTLGDWLGALNARIPQS